MAAVDEEATKVQEDTANAADEKKTPAQLADDVYGFKDSIEKRFPNIQGALRMKEIDKLYEKPRGPSSHLPNGALRPLMLWKDGRKCCRRHRLNNRRQDAVVQIYAKRFLKEGYMGFARGLPLHIASEPNDEGYEHDMIGGATVIECIYVAAALEPSNVFVVQIRNFGIELHKEYNANTPDDVILWVKFEHNRWAEGSLVICISHGRHG